MPFHPSITLYYSKLQKFYILYKVNKRTVISPKYSSLRGPVIVTETRFSAKPHMFRAKKLPEP